MTVSAHNDSSQIPGPSVAILLGTYNGARFLSAQMESFEAQTHANWTVWASDNGSADGTLAILERYQQKWGRNRMHIVHSSADGPTQNFMSLVQDENISADFYAYSDQDDIWEADKLERAIGMLQAELEHSPRNALALYCSRTRYVDENNMDLGYSQRFMRPPSFANALMQNIAGGNTMVFNAAACRRLRSVDRHTDIVIHDWWTYLVVSGCGGSVLYDSYPSVRYRQHSGNIIGMNANWPARMLRIRKLFRGQFKSWNDRNTQALILLEPWLTHRNRMILETFIRARRRWLVPRLAGLFQAGVYRQTLLGNLGIVVAGIFGKL
ncbi:glycosyltransferase family 2 protein [Pollutimonas sp. M17]|uniref:glycosyltransferase family 2 protein n=1 Tax=Pollutimonas sp. M17 TaxID=2962065 RepID=UPI0021F42411|nr:glycosyltransferase family 2 protein [Pollutimonas sp. M17]UYO94040.1 glycosyltransferase family 2 protein [Pollutimonas sp. M17]